MFKVKPTRPSPAMTIALAASLMMFTIPIFVRGSYTLHIIILILLYSCTAQSWNILSGYIGVSSFGHQAFFGIGAYMSALFAMRLGISPWIGLLIGGLVSAGFGLVVGYPVLRLRGGAYTAIVTLAFAEIIRISFMNLVEITRGELGLWGIPVFPSIVVPGLGKISFEAGARAPYYYIVLIIFLLTFFISYKLVNSRIGLAFRAIRESEDAAENLGVNLTKYKLLAFVISAFLAGVCGSFYAHYILILMPTTVLASGVVVDMIAMTFVGGQGTLFGPILGSFILISALEYLRFLMYYRWLIYGGLFVIVMLFAPAGLIPKVVEIAQRGMIKDLLRASSREIEDL